MLSRFTRFATFVLLLVAPFASNSIAQMEMNDGQVDCPQPFFFGLFREKTGNRWTAENGRYEDSMLYATRKDAKKKIVALNQIDEIDPAYRIVISVSDRGKSRAACIDEKSITGELVSPFGKLFQFAYARFDQVEQSLIFETVERDEIRFQGELKFKPLAKFRRQFDEGTANIVAKGKRFGVVEISFEFSSWSQ